MPNNLKDHNIWLTGASSGIGKDLLERLLENQATVFATSRSLDSLAALKKIYPSQLILLPADISNPESIKSCISEIKQHVTYLDKIILDAGVCHYLEMPNFNAQVFQDNFKVNFFGMLDCIEQAWPLLMAAKFPHLVGMSSSVAYLAIPRAEAYGSSKAAVLYTLRALQSHPTTPKLDVSIVCPGFVDTPLTARNTFPMPFLISSQQASIYIIKGILKRKKEISFPLRLIWIFKLVAMLPDQIRIAILSRTVTTK